jgi:TIR domain
VKNNAFISYSHAADSQLALARQSGLHQFARPWNRIRALKVFRDKSSLGASPELWPSIIAALSDSEYFLLMASPQSAESKWVQKEIDWWLDNRSPEKLLILLTDGELLWDDAGGGFNSLRTNALAQQVQQGFRLEPLWVDLRWARSGENVTLCNGQFRQAVLDLAAPWLSLRDHPLT